MPRPAKETVRYPGWPIALIIIFAAIIRLAVIHHGLPYTASPEESRVIAQGFKITTEGFKPTDPDKPALLTLGGFKPREYDKPVVTSYVLAGEYGAFFGLGNFFGRFNFVHEYQAYFLKYPSPFIILARLTSLVFGLLSIYMLYYLARGVFEWSIALMAAFILAVEPHHVYFSSIGTGDSLALLFALAGLYFLLQLAEEKRLGSAFYSAFLFGLAASMRFEFVVLLVAAYVAYFVVVPREYKFGAAVFGVPFVFVGFLFGMVLPNGLLLLQRDEFRQGVAVAVIKGVSYGNLADANLAAGVLRDLVSVNIHSAALGWCLAGGGALGLLAGLFFAKYNRMKFFMAALALVVPAVFFFPSYLRIASTWVLLIAAPLALGAAYLVYRICWRKWLPASVAASFMMVLTAVIAAQGACETWLMYTHKASAESRYEFAAWARQNLPDLARVVVTPYADVIPHSGNLIGGPNWASWRADVRSAWNNRAFQVAVISAPPASSRLPNMAAFDFLVVDSQSLEEMKSLAALAGPSAPPGLQRFVARKAGLVARLARAKDFLAFVERARAEGTVVQTFKGPAPDMIGGGPVIEVIQLPELAPAAPPPPQPAAAPAAAPPQASPAASGVVPTAPDAKTAPGMTPETPPAAPSTDSRLSVPDASPAVG